MQERHRHRRRARWDLDGAHLAARRLVHCIKHRLGVRHASRPSRAVDQQRPGDDDLRLAAGRTRRERDASEQGILAGHGDHATVRDPPLLVTAVHVVRRDAAVLLRLDDRHAAEHRYVAASLEAAAPRRRRDVSRRWGRCTDQAAVVARGAVAEFAARILLQADRRHAALRADVDHPRLGIHGAAAIDVHATRSPGRIPRALRTCRAVGGRTGNEVRTHAAALREFERGVANGRRVVDQIRGQQPLLRIRRWLARDRLRRRRALVRHVALQHLRFRHRPDRLSRHTIEGVEPALLGALRDRLATHAIHGDVDQVRRHRRVVIPDVVMHHLEVPLPLARLRIQCDQRVAEQVVAGAMAAVFVHQRHADGDVDHSEVRIGGIRGPRIVLAHTFGAGCRAVRPGLRAELTRLRNEVELPHLLARADVEATDRAGNVPHAHRVVAVDRRVADHDHLAHHDRRRARTDLTVHRIDAHRAIGPDLLHRVPRLACLRLSRRRRVGNDQRARIIHRQRHHRVAEAILQVDHTIRAELRIGTSRFRIQRHHVVAGRHDDHAFLGAVGPVRRATSRELTWRLLPADAFLESVHPERLARLRLDRHHRPACGGHGEQPSVRVQRRGAIVLIGTEGARVPLPCLAQRVEVRGVDLVQWRVARAVRVAAPVAPFTGRIAPHQRRHGGILTAGGTGRAGSLGLRDCSDERCRRECTGGDHDRGGEETRLHQRELWVEETARTESSRIRCNTAESAVRGMLPVGMPFMRSRNASART